MANNNHCDGYYSKSVLFCVWKQCVVKIGRPCVFQINTGVQLFLVAASLAAPVFHYTDSVLLQSLWWAFTAPVTITSSLQSSKYWLQLNKCMFCLFAGTLPLWRPQHPVTATIITVKRPLRCWTRQSSCTVIWDWALTKTFG